MLNIVVNAAVASALVAAAPSDHQGKFVPSKLRGISSSGPSGREGEHPKPPVRASKRSDSVLLEKFAEATPVGDVEVGTPQENILTNTTIPASDTRKKIQSVFDPSEELGHLDNTVVQENTLREADTYEVVDDQGFVLESDVPLYNNPDDMIFWQHRVGMEHNNNIDGYSESLGGYDNRAVVSNPAFDMEEVNQEETLVDEVKALAEKTSSVNRSIARDLGKEVQNSDSCGGNYPVIYVSGGVFRNLVDFCVNGDSSCTSPYNEVPLGCWETSRVTDMSRAFQDLKGFNDDISLWNTAKVTDMQFMFEDALVFNQDISYWDVSNVRNMRSMFEDAYTFNQPIGSLHVSNVRNMKRMFRYADYFNQPLDNWDVGNVEYIDYMFDRAISFNQPLDNWDVGKTTDLSGMFYYAYSFNQPLNNWNVGNAEYMYDMFYNAIAFNQPLDNWDVGNVNGMTRMFKKAYSFNQPLDNWDVGKVSMMNKMFEGSDFDQCLSSWGQKVPAYDFYGDEMFYNTNCPGIDTPEPNDFPWCQRVEDGCEVVFRSFLSCTDLASLSQDSLGILCNKKEIGTNCRELCPTSAPTSSPTSAPTSSPTSAPTSSPTLDIDCEDKSKTFTIDIDGTLKTKDCEWLASKKIAKQKEYCKMTVEVNDIEKGLKKICKKTCGEVGKGECAFLQNS